MESTAGVTEAYESASGSDPQTKEAYPSLQCRELGSSRQSWGQRRRRDGTGFGQQARLFINTRSYQESLSMKLTVDGNVEVDLTDRSAEALMLKSRKSTYDMVLAELTNRRAKDMGIMCTDG